MIRNEGASGRIASRLNSFFLRCSRDTKIMRRCEKQSLLKLLLNCISMMRVLLILVGICCAPVTISAFTSTRRTRIHTGTCRTSIGPIFKEGNIHTLVISTVFKSRLGTKINNASAKIANASDRRVEPSRIIEMQETIKNDDDSIPTFYDRDSKYLDITATRTENEYRYSYCSDDDVDDTLRRLVSPAPESFHVIDSCVGRINEKIMKKKEPREYVCDIKNTALLEDVSKDLMALSSYILKPGSCIELYYSYEDSYSPEINVFMWRVVDAEDTSRSSLNGSESYEGRIFRCDELIKSLSTSPSLEMYHEYNVLELSRHALELATGGGGGGGGGNGNSVNLPGTSTIDTEIERIVQQAEIRLALTMGSDLRGRTSADACFNFALAGVHRADRLFQTLVRIAIHELRRVGTRSSFKPKYILQMIEKFAACDIQGQSSSSSSSVNIADELYQLAADCLEQKGHEDTQLLECLKNGSFGFHSDRPLLWLWRFSARKRKISLSDYSFSSSTGTIDWDDIFLDSSKPLVIDIGSGMGASLLNLSTMVKHDYGHDQDNSSDGLSSSSSSTTAVAAGGTTGALDIDWSNCNYAGADLNPCMVRFANGIISRDSNKRMGRIKFFHLSAVDFLKELRTYRGDIDLIMIHFPSPYRLLTSSSSSSAVSDDNGNSQLPSLSAAGFMVTEELIGLASELLNTRRIPKDDLSTHTRTRTRVGHLFFQTKCEDVAVYLKNLCLSSSRASTSTTRTGTFECVPSPNPVLNVDQLYKQEGKGGEGTRPQRVEKWIKAMPETERAEGSCWWNSSSSCIPSLGRAETEVQCDFENTVVHRCLLKLRE